jgi:hypothetical protein
MCAHVYEFYETEERLEAYLNNLVNEYKIESRTSKTKKIKDVLKMKDVL